MSAVPPYPAPEPQRPASGPPGQYTVPAAGWPDQWSRAVTRPDPRTGPPAALPPAPQPPPPQAPRHRPRLLVTLASTGTALLVGAAVATVLLLRPHDGGTPPGTPAAASAPVSSSVPGPRTGTGKIGTGTGTGRSSSPGAPRADEQTFLRQVDGIIAQSSLARAQVSSAIAGVRSGCSVAPATAAQMIDAVLANRQSVLAQAGRLDTSSGALAAGIRQKLIDALTASMEADQDYATWLADLTTAFPGSDPPGCPGGSAPSDAHYLAATQASLTADAAKKQFVAAYDPAAGSAGLREWSDTDF